MSKGKKIFKFPEELNMNENSRQHDDQIKRLISNGQIEETNDIRSKP